MLVTRAGLVDGRVGARLGHRRRRRDGCADDREGARRARARHLVERREARSARASSARTPSSTTRPGTLPRRAKEATGGAAIDVVVEHVGEATWKTLARRRRAGGRIAVCGATTRPEPARALHRVWWKQLTILGSTMGTRADFAARTSSSRRAARSRDRPRLPLARRSARRTSASKRASSSARSSSPSLIARQIGACPAPGPAVPVEPNAPARGRSCRPQDMSGAWHELRSESSR